MKLSNIRVLAGATCIEGVRHRALWAIVVFSIILSAGNIIFTTFFAWDLGKVAIEFGLSASSFCGLLLIFFLALKIMVDDLERNRIYMILSRPVSIAEYIVGKYGGLALVLLLSVIIMSLGTSISMYYVLSQYPAFVPPDFSWQIYVMVVICQWLGLLVVLALCFFWFSWTSHSFIALLFLALSYILGQNMETLRYVIEKNPQAGFLGDQEWLVKLVSWLLPNLSLFDKKSHAAYGLPFSWADFSLIVVYGLSYIGLLLFFSVFLYKRKELAK